MVMYLKPRKNSVLRRLGSFVCVYTFGAYNAESNNPELIKSNKNAKLRTVGQVEHVCRLFSRLL